MEIRYNAGRDILRLGYLLVDGAVGCRTLPIIAINALRLFMMGSCKKCGHKKSPDRIDLSVLIAIYTASGLIKSSVPPNPVLAV